MRMAFGVLSLLIVVAIIGVLAKKQLGAVSGPAPGAETTQGVSVPTGMPKQQVDQFRKSVESAVQQAPRQSEEPAK
jgi:hypothetical protein